MSEEVPPYYTLARWKVKPGNEEAFVDAWRDMGMAFAATVPGGRTAGTLLQSLKEPSTYYSFGPWDSEAAIERMRADPAAKETMGRALALCEDATPGAYRTVTRLVVEGGQVVQG